MYADAEVQTDLTASNIDVMADCKEKLENKTRLKRDLFIEDVCKNNQTVGFYTGVPSLACLFMVFNFLQPIAEKMKYWDGKKKNREGSLSGWRMLFSHGSSNQFNCDKLQFFSICCVKEMEFF